MIRTTAGNLPMNSPWVTTQPGTPGIGVLMPRFGPIQGNKPLIRNREFTYLRRTP